MGLIEHVAATEGLDAILRSKNVPSIRGRRRTLEGAFTLPKIGLYGYVYVDLIDARSGLIKRHLEFPNVITNAALNGIGDATATGKSLGAYLGSGFCGVGTGTTAPAVTDTGLQTATGVRTSSVGGGATTSGFGAANAYSYIRVVREFSEAQSNGNLTEFGMFNASSSGIMLCRQLFKDSGGTPTEIIKTSSDKLRITYEFRIYPPTVDGTNVVTINAVNYTWTSRAMQIGTDSAWGFSGSTGLLNVMGAISVSPTDNLNAQASNHTTLSSTTGSGPTGGSQTANRSSSARTAYVADSFASEWTVIWEPAVGNFTNGVRAFMFQPWGSAAGFTHQMVLSAYIPKISTQRLTLVFQLSWARHAL